MFLLVFGGGGDGCYCALRKTLFFLFDLISSLLKHCRADLFFYYSFVGFELFFLFFLEEKKKKKKKTTHAMVHIVHLFWWWWRWRQTYSKCEMRREKHWTSKREEKTTNFLRNADVPLKKKQQENLEREERTNTTQEPPHISEKAHQKSMFIQRIVEWWQ